MIKSAEGVTPQASVLATGRRNARVAAGDEPAAHAALSVLLESGHGWDALAADLVDGREPDVPAHGLCSALVAGTAACYGAGAVPLDRGPIATHLRVHARVPGPVAQRLGRSLAAADGRPSASLTLGGLPLRELLPGLVVLTCPELRRCPTRRDVSAALAAPGAAEALGDLRLGTRASRRSPGASAAQPPTTADASVANCVR